MLSGEHSARGAVMSRKAEKWWSLDATSALKIKIVNLSEMYISVY